MHLKYLAIQTRQGPIFNVRKLARSEAECLKEGTQLFTGTQRSRSWSKELRI